MFRTLHTSLLFLCCLFLSQFVFAQVSSVLSSRAAEIGESNSYTLKVITNDSSIIKLKPWNIDQNLEFFNESPWVKNNNGFEKSWNLIAWDSGYYEIPPFELFIGDKAFETNPHNLIVGDIQLADSTQLAAIKPIIEEQATIEDYLNYLYILVFIAILGFIFWYVYKTNKANVDLLDPPAEELKRPAHIIAKKALALLDTKNFLEDGEEEEYETSLSYISRKYISSRFGILALEKGNKSFMAELQKLKDFPTHILNEMLKTLPEMELVKYAGQSISTEKHLKYRALIGQLIEETSGDKEQKYILVKEDEVLQEAIEEGMQRSLSLGAVKKLNRLLIESGHYGSESSNTILCKWHLKFPFLKSDAAAVELPKPIIDWHEKGMSSFFKLYNRIGIRLTNTGVIGTVLFMLFQPLFLISSVLFIVIDLVQGKKIFGTGNIVLESNNEIKFLYQVQENAKTQEL